MAGQYASWAGVAAPLSFIVGRQKGRRMSYDEFDAAYDEYLDELLKEFRETEGQQIADDAIAGFQDERLQSYFIANPTLVEPAVRQLRVARLLYAQNHHGAALVFASSAVEVGLKQTLFRPIVYGLVHSAPAAVIIAELSLGHAALDRFKTLLLDILAGYVGTDLRKYTSPGAAKSLWEEIKDSQEARNAILHRGEERSAADADVALRSASAVLETLFPAVASAIGLHVHDGVRVCKAAACKDQR